MATDYISREAAIKAIMEHTGMTPIAKLVAETTICRVPAADVRPVIHGRWIPMTYISELTENGWPNCRWEKAIEPDSVDGLMCSKCGEIFDFVDARIFCTQCGADMRKLVEIDQVKEGAE